MVAEVAFEIQILWVVQLCRQAYLQLSKVFGFMTFLQYYCISCLATEHGELRHLTYLIGPDDAE